MKGAIAAGHPLTADAGARVLAAGGNAVDACIAAGLASWVTESPLTGPGGGGFLLVHRARDRTTRLLDFFVAVPGAGDSRSNRHEMQTVDVDYDGSSSQVFHVGAASAAVPGAAAGLEVAHRSFGSLPWPILFEDAISLARGGVELTKEQAYLHAILDSILRHAESGRGVYGLERRLTLGEMLVMPDLAKTLEELADRGPAALYRGEIGRAVVDHLRDHGGRLTIRDLEEYRVIWRRPLEVPWLGRRFFSNSPPSSGGILIAYGLQLLERIGLGGPAGSAGAIAALAEVMREQTHARTRRFGRELYRGGLARRLLAEESLTAAVERIRRAGPGGTREAAEPAQTTHISVVDDAGNAASMTVSNGSGSGVVPPGTGIHLNNMLGEYDLSAGARRAPGGRLTSMMAPSIVLAGDRPELVVGSAGSVRLRGAIMQIAANAVGHRLSVEEAVTRPRVHFEDGHLHCEGGSDPAVLDELEAIGYDLVRWRRRNLYFGGAAAVSLSAGGPLAAAGDPRRGGAGVVVDA